MATPSPDVTLTIEPSFYKWLRAMGIDMLGPHSIIRVTDREELDKLTGPECAVGLTLQAQRILQALSGVMGAMEALHFTYHPNIDMDEKAVAAAHASCRDAFEEEVKNRLAMVMRNHHAKRNPDFRVVLEDMVKHMCQYQLELIEANRKKRFEWYSQSTGHQPGKAV